jgi:signal transduction histidine kinase/CheY-like chemotaxis protein
MSLGFRVNLVVFLVLGFLLIAIIILLNNRVTTLTLQTGNKQVSNESEIIRIQLDRAQQDMHTAIRVLASTQGLVDSVVQGDPVAVENTVILGAGSFDFDDIDIIDREGNRLVDFVPVRDQQQEDTFLNMGTRGLTIGGVIVDEAEHLFRLVVVIPLRDHSEKIVGSLLASRHIDGEFLDEVVFSRDDIHLALIHDQQILAYNLSSTQDHPLDITTFSSAFLLKPEAIARASQGNRVLGTNLLYVQDTPYALAYIPLSASRESDAVIGVLVSMSELDVFLDEFSGDLTLLFTLLALGAIGVMALLARTHVAIPIRRLQEAARRIAQGEYTSRVAQQHQDEIGQLAHAFNTMAQAVEERERSLHHMAASLDTSNTALRIQTQHAEEARVAAEEANLAKSRFLANMSHELRTPLNAIIGYSEMLGEEAADTGNEDFVHDLEKIQAAGKHLLRLINDILDFSKIEAGKMDLYLETFSVASLIDEVATTIQPMITQHENVLEVIAGEHLSSMHADTTKIRQILFNLLSNAAKFTEHGTITFEISRLEEAPTSKHTTEDAAEELAQIKGPPPFIMFQVRDTGIGMTPDQKRNLFQAFNQADASTTRKYGGTGLGLAISRHFCHMMGGAIVVESISGEGTTFTVYLPTHVAEKPPNSDDDYAERPGHTYAASSAHTSSEGAQSVVLVIDDDATSRDLLRHFLNQQGFEVVTAASGEEGLQVATELRPDVIILDIIMPRMDGWAVLNALHETPALSDIPVIVVTIVDDRKMGFALGASDYLVKPVDRSRLTSVLHTYLHRQAPHRPRSVLLVEDDDSTREMLRRTLEKDGWHVAEAHNGHTAIMQVSYDQPDIIVLDLMMPDMDGFQVISRLRSTPAWQHIPVIVVTAKELTILEQQQLSGSVEQTLQKGKYSREEFLNEINELVRSHTTSAK